MSMKATSMDAEAGKQHNRNFFRFAFESFLLSLNKKRVSHLSVQEYQASVGG